ncbi:HEAT repeat domain-containing protein [Sorangium sp. So ce295]|uniref:HEAT repeat domain-containing protein n=1 Tax=Sorangium sp. So ce295 TaxID=3133295 RepID=UPI003F612DF9
MSSPFAQRFLRRRRSIAVAAALLALGVPAARHAMRAAEPVYVTPRVHALSLRFEPGSVLHYHVAWSGEQRGRLFAAGVGATETHTSSATDMALDMALFVESVEEDGATLVLSFTDVLRHRLDVLGTEAFPAREHATTALMGRHARVRVGTDGVSRDVAFEAGAPDVFMNLVQWVVAQSSVSLGPSATGTSWEANERGPFGASVVRYAQDEQDLTRERVRYSSFDAFSNPGPASLRVRELRGGSSIRVHGGAIERVESEERVRVDGPDGASELDGRARFELRLVRVDRGEAAPAGIAFDAPHPAGEPIVGADTLRELLAQRVDGLTRERLLSDLAQFGNGGVMPAHTRWLWRATGLLEREPTIARDLAKLALEPGATDKARVLIMDLLASAGHEEAQAAMRAVLASPALARSPLRAPLVQRVSFLEAPTSETADAVWDAFQDGQRQGYADLAYASAHALAAASGAASANGDAATANALVARLGREIASAETPEARAALLGSLTNARSPEVLAIAEPYTASEDAALREASAEALRRVDTPEAKDLLITLARDTAVEVQSTALAALRDRTLTATDWRDLAAAMSEGRFGSALDGTLLTLATSQAQALPEALELVAQLAARPGTSAAIRARARAILAAVG